MIGGVTRTRMRWRETGTQGGCEQGGKVGGGGGGSEGEDIHKLGIFEDVKDT